MDMEYLVRDTIEYVRPKLKLITNYLEGCAAAEALDTEFRAKLSEWKIYFNHILLTLVLLYQSIYSFKQV